jgi:outer membrane protein assembly factor BamB
MRLLLGLVAVTLWADNWPGWRGPTANGISTETGIPNTWSPTQNIAWKTPLPGRGRSSPIVWGDRVFLTAELDGDAIPGAKAPIHFLRGEPFLHPDSQGADRSHQLVVLSLDRKTGKILWQKTAYAGKVFDNRHKAGSYAAPTPITDGRNVYAYFGSEGFYAFDYDGKLLWKFDPGPIKTIGMGPGTSPVMDADRIYLQCDNGEENKSYLVALDKKSGKTQWRVERPVNLTWSTPLFFDGALVTAATEKVIAYDPKTGKQLWEAPGVKGNSVPSPVSGDGVVVVSAGYPEKFASAIGPGGKALWNYAKGTAYVPSPIFYGAYVYLITDKGLLTCIDSKTGEVKYEGKRPPVPATFAGSPVAYDGKILITSEDGDSFVIKAGPEHTVLHSNSIGEPVLSSPALSNGMLFLRGKSHLFAIAAQ